MFVSPFNAKQDVLIPDQASVVFVSDLFADEYVGGAELTTQALIDSAPTEKGVITYCVKSKDISMKTLESGSSKFWVFGNFSGLDIQLIPTIVANLNYSILEYDYKFCRYRSIELHKMATEEDCDCADSDYGKLISAFFHGARTVYWMSHNQRLRYVERFPFMKEDYASSKHVVLSSVFDDKFFAEIKLLRETYKEKNEKYIVLDSSSWIKGTKDCINYCKAHNLEYELVGGLSHGKLLEKLAQSKGLVFLPKGGDTCPRLVLEAQLLDCDLILNDNVQHKDEFPFSENNLEDIEIYLYGRRETFWNKLLTDASWEPNISGYTTTFNCISQKYPYEACIKSMLGFCKEVIVLDGGSTDGTFERLESLAKEDGRIKVHSNKVDWSAKRSAVHDGLQKAKAREKCAGHFCWQMDCDEIVHENDYVKIKKICQQFPRFVDLISLPVIEFWGSKGKVRCDVTPWKWRLSRNKPNITHGIPGKLRRQDENGELYAAIGTDGCDYIDRETLEPLPHSTFYTEDVHYQRLYALNGSEEAVEKYSDTFQRIIDLLPSVYHYSWYDIERKILTYKNFWQNHWESLYNIKQEDTIENNMFFNKKWKDVTEKDIKDMACKLENETSGHVFHSKIDFEKPTPSLKLTYTEPEVLINEDA